MDDKTLLLKAAREGNTSILKALLEKDPLLLDKIMIMPLFTETPLHIATLAGKLEFVKHLLTVAPESAHQSNRHGVNALHMAAAKGHVDVVVALLDINHELDLMFDVEGCGPLHYAASHGRSEVVRVMVSRNVSLLKQVNFMGETAIHVAVKCNQHQVLKVMEDLLSNFGDDQFCKDVLMHVKDDFGYSVATLVVASSYKGNNTSMFQAYVNQIRESGDQVNNNKNNNNQVASTSTEVPSKQLDMEKETEYFLRQVTLVIMVLIATVSFQALISPPQFFWRDGGLNAQLFHDLQTNKWANQFLNFLVSNTTAFLISCWGLFAVLMRKDLKMILFWLGASITSVFLSYLYVLLPMLRGNVKYMFLKRLFIFISTTIFLSVVRYSLTFQKLCANLKGFWQRFRHNRTEITANEANTNAMISTTYRSNSSQV